MNWKLILPNLIKVLNYDGMPMTADQIIRKQVVSKYSTASKFLITTKFIQLTIFHI
jgi:hypothetical protein